MTRHFLDSKPYDWALPGARELHDVLCDIDLGKNRTRQILQELRIPVVNVNWDQAAADYLRQVLEEVADLFALKDLLELLLAEDDLAAFHDQLRLLAKPPDGAIGPGAVGGPVPGKRTAEGLLDAQIWDLIGRVLRNFVLDEADPAAELRKLLPEDLVMGLALGADSRENLPLVLDAVKASEFAGEDSVVVGLLRGLLALPPLADDPHLTTALEDLLDQPVEDAPLPYDDFVLYNDKVFLNQSEVRLALRSLTDPEGPLVLSLMADEPCGKSHTLHLIQHLKNPMKFNVAKVTHEEATTPAEVVETLGSYITSADPPAWSDTDPAKSNRRSATWLVQQALHRQEAWWLVLDGYSRDRLDSDLEDLVHLLALRISEERRDTLRLVLLGYQGTVPPEIRRRHDRQTPRVLGENDLREFFGHFFADVGKFDDEAAELGVTPQEVRDAYVGASVERVAKDARTARDAATGDSHPTKVYMTALHRGVVDLIESS